MNTLSSFSAEAQIWAVADGMGGAAKGDWASVQVTTALAPVDPGDDLNVACERVADALAAANVTIFSTAQAEGSTIGSTAAVLLLVNDAFAVIWAGDSRVYRWNRGALRQLSRDHSRVEELIQAGAIPRAAARNHPLGNVITRAIGVEADLALDVVTGEVEDNDRFLICSDGLTGCLSETDIAERLQAGEPQEACDRLVQDCLGRGAPDNVSIVVIACERTTIAGLGAAKWVASA
jgi:serine/threonine protein phosphatase Stp1